MSPKAQLVWGSWWSNEWAFYRHWSRFLSDTNICPAVWLLRCRSRDPSLSFGNVEMVENSLFLPNPVRMFWSDVLSGCRCPHHPLWRKFFLTPCWGSGPMFSLICKPKQRRSPFHACSCLLLLLIGHQAGAWLSPECSLIVALFPNALQLLLLWLGSWSFTPCAGAPDHCPPAQIGSWWRSVSQTMADGMMSSFLREPNSDVKTWKDSVAWIRSG